MAVNLSDVVDKFRYRLLQAGLDEAKTGVYAFQVASWFDQAAERLAGRILDSGDEAKISLLMKEYLGVAVTSGVVDLSSGTYDPVIIEAVPSYGNLKSASGNLYPWQWVPTLSMLQLRRPLQGIFIQYTFDGRKIRTRDTNGSLTGLGGTVDIKAPATPTVSANVIDIHPRLVDELLDIFLEMYHEITQPAMAQEEGEKV